jgi:perosamine synthetase
LTRPEIRIPLSAPDISSADIEAVVNVLRTPRLSLGPKTEEFEAAVADYVGVPYGVALSSGTAGLHLGLRALGIGEGDEVILPSFTFIGVANAVLCERARPVFVDIDPLTLNMDPGKIEQAITSKTRAILVVHTFGYPADMDPILDIARRHGLRVIEDACEALGAEFRGQRVGGIGDLGVFAFYPNKPITTGEGGLAVTRDAVLAETIRALRNQGRRPADGWLEHRLPGFNYRISEINCALGLAQLKRIDSILNCREALAIRYAEALRSIPEVNIPLVEVQDGRVCWFVFVVRLSTRFSQADRDHICHHLAARGIQSGRYFAPLHLQPLCTPFVNSRQDLATTEQVAARTLALPFFNKLTDEEMAEVCSILREALRDLT